MPHLDNEIKYRDKFSLIRFQKSKKRWNKRDYRRRNVDSVLISKIRNESPNNKVNKHITIPDPFSSDQSKITFLNRKNEFYPASFNINNTGNTTESPYTDSIQYAYTTNCTNQTTENSIKQSLNSTVSLFTFISNHSASTPENNRAPSWTQEEENTTQPWRLGDNTTESSNQTPPHSRRTPNHNTTQPWTPNHNTTQPWTPNHSTTQPWTPHHNTTQPWTPNHNTTRPSTPNQNTTQQWTPIHSTTTTRWSPIYNTTMAPQTEHPISNTTEFRPSNSQNSTNLWSILLGVSIPLGIIFLVVFMYFIYRHHKSNNKRAVPLQNLNRNQLKSAFKTIPVYNFNSEYQRRLDLEIIQQEYNTIGEFSSRLNEKKSKAIGQDLINKPKNRFIDIIPYDDSLIELSTPSGIPPSTYINASAIKMKLQGISCNYIATQGPKRNTMIDFWNMIIEQNVRLIVCLTNCVEAGRIKCTQYWPDVGEMLHFNEITLRTKDERIDVSGEVIIRNIEIIVETTVGVTYNVSQVHLKSWPDHGVPSTTYPLLKVCRIIRHHQKMEILPSVNLLNEGTNNRLYESSVTHSPIVVHCSAGVGRTGTLIAVDLICQLILKDLADTKIDICDLVKHLREQRPKMVQTFQQYQFIYECVNDFINFVLSKQRKKDRERETRYQRSSDDDYSTYTNEAFVD